MIKRLISILILLGLVPQCPAQYGAAVPLGTNWYAIDHGQLMASYDPPAYCYRAANATIANGALNLTTTVHSSTCNGVSTSYDSAIVYAKNYSFTFGTVEAYLSSGPVNGTYPAFWMLGNACHTPDWVSFWTYCPTWMTPDYVEIDFPEDFLYNTGTQWSINSNVTSLFAYNYTPVNPGGWHDVKMVWNSTSITWYDNGAQITQTTNLTQIPQTAMFPIFDVAMQTSSERGGPITDSNFPITMKVAWIKITPLTGPAFYENFAAETSGTTMTGLTKGSVIQ